jgi:hypothetical protein
MKPTGWDGQAVALLAFKSWRPVADEVTETMAALAKDACFRPCPDSGRRKRTMARGTVEMGLTVGLELGGGEAVVHPRPT